MVASVRIRMNPLSPVLPLPPGVIHFSLPTAAWKWLSRGFLAALLVPLATADASWRSALYPEDWKPGFADAQGRFLPDFSYAGYHRGEKPLPRREGLVIEVTQPPYSADATGKQDATAAIQAALDAAAAQGGGVVFLPAGTYRIAPPEGQSSALRVEGDQVVLRGAGPDRTFLFNDEIQMREKNVISVRAKDPAWWYVEGKWVQSTPATRDFADGSLTLPVENPGLFQPGDPVIVRNDPTENFIASLGMTGKWTPKNLKNRALVFLRRIVAIDPAAGTVTVDAPIRYALKKEDNARVLKLPGKLISEVGLEDFSLGMKQHPGEGWGEEDFGVEGTAAYDVHQSHAIVFTSAENCWMRRVNSFAPSGNSPTVHVLSNGVKFLRSRQVTAEDCDWRNTQYQGGGGNGYLYTLHGNECLIHRCRAENGRHNYDFGTMASSGNVLLDCLAKDGRLASDFHMHFSVSNLHDNTTCDGDFLEAKYRPWGGTPVHGVTTSQSVFWNTHGLRYIASPFEFNGSRHARPQVLVESEQFANGYVIGTRGPANKVKSSNFVEGVGRGDALEPPSLYRDQLARRLAR